MISAIENILFPPLWDKNTSVQVLFKPTFINEWNVLSEIGNHVTKAIKHRLLMFL